MGKERKENGVIVVKRDDITPDSERHVERDDPLFHALRHVFAGKQIEFNLETIAAECGVEPEDVFTDLHENYGYICIGTGENPATGEKLSTEEVAQRKQAIKQALEAQGIPHILIKGKYMGVEEDTYFIPFNDKTIGLAAVLQGEMVKKVEAIAHVHKQDSLLICQAGQACYLYTSGPQKGCVITGNAAIVYPGKEQLPDDCYSLFVRADNTGTTGFTCALNFNRTYSSIQEYVDEVNKTRQEHYDDFATACLAPSSTSNIKPKKIVLLRGTNGYNDYAIELKTKLEQSGLKVAIFGSDANIAKINEEIAADNAQDPKGPKASWQWPQILNEFIKRNNEIYQSLLQSDVDVIVYADMNKIADFMKPYITAALQQGHQVMSNVVNSFAFEPARSDFVEKLCQQFGSFMARHVADFKSEKGQINAKSVNVGDMVIPQHHGLATEALALMLTLEQPSVSALNSGLVRTTFASSTQQDEQEEVNSTSTPIAPAPMF